jgi:hypothetical protein
LVCVDDDGSCSDGTFDARYGYDLGGHRLWARLHDGSEERQVLQLEGLADWTRGSLDVQIHVVAFGVPARLAARPGAAAVGVLASAVLVAPPQALAGGNPGGNDVYRRWLFHDHLGTNVLVTSRRGSRQTYVARIR